MSVREVYEVSSDLYDINGNEIIDLPLFCQEGKFLDITLPASLALEDTVADYADHQ